MIENYNYIGTILSGLIQEIKLKEKHIQFLQKDYIYQDIRTTHWVGHSLLPRIRLQWFYFRKNMIEYLEADLTGKPIDALNPEDLAVAEEANADKYITV